MIALRLITAFYAIALCYLLVASESNHFKINKYKQNSLLNLYLSNNERDDLGVSNSETKSILGFHDTPVFLSVSTLLKSREIGILHKNADFSQFESQHMDEAARIFDLLTAAPNYDNFIQRATVLKGHVNRYLFLSSVQKALLYRSDTNDVQAPPLWQMVARSFFTDDAINAAIRNAAADSQTSSSVPISRAGTPGDPETQLSWFREDIGLNTMHTIQRMMVHSDEATIESKAMGCYGDLLYGGLVSRYNAERQVADMDEVQPLDLDNVIMESYDSRLRKPSGDEMFASRPSGMKPHDVTRNGKTYTVASLRNLERQADKAIESGYMIKNDGTKTVTTPLNLFRTIIGFYGKEKFDKVYGEGFHMYEHMLLASMTDQNGEEAQELNVLGFTETSLRDPLFYRMHAEKNKLFQLYENLPPYSEKEFEFSNVKIDDVALVSTTPDEKDAKQTNVLKTYMETVEIDIQHDPTVARDRSPGDQTPIMVGVQRLNHEGFMYNLFVTNRNAVPVSATTRIFIAPSIDQRTGQPFRNLIEQRKHFFEMDKFVIILQPGVNVIDRQDVESSIASPSKLSVENLRTEGMEGRRNADCFWPQNLLLPRGNAEGVEFDVFVLLTDRSRDQEAFNSGSNSTPNPCGIMSDNDKHVGGYPFERKITHSAADYLGSKGNNAFFGKVKIYHDN